MQVSQKGIDLIKKFEGFSSVPYKCPAGKNTIGYGHSFTPSGQINYISSEEAEKLLKRDLVRIKSYIDSAVKVELTQGKFDALCSLIYNWGCGSFGQSKGLRELNKGNYVKAANEFFSRNSGVVNIKGKFSNGLYSRRQAELELWNG
jgi:lysozyme